MCAFYNYNINLCPISHYKNVIYIWGIFFYIILNIIPVYKKVAKKNEQRSPKYQKSASFSKKYDGVR